MKKLSPTLLLVLFGLLLLAAVLGEIPEQTSLPGDPLAGARIYDNWMTALDLNALEGDHPLWATQESNTRSDDVTWRCKECHAWDYKGADGVNGPSSIRYTGFPSLTRAVGSSQEELLAWLDGTNNPDHNFLQFTNPNAVNDLAIFLRTMQVDLALLIDYESGLALGNELAGESLYLNTCAECHGDSGRRIDFSSGGSPLYVADIAAVDPWRTVHVVRFGTAVGNMPGTEELGWSLSSVADLLAYAQSLTRGNPNFTISEQLTTEEADIQGETTPILWATAAILMVIMIGLIWSEIRNR
jgi:mono/diheme cytochrome c family protein